jgi:hypothetical protein
MRRFLASSAAIVACLVACLIATAPSASAANVGASCLGVGSSANAGFPRDRAVISHDVKDFADALGVTSGVLISGGARQHLGSPSACFGE